MMTPSVALDDAEILADVLKLGTPHFDVDAARAVLRLGFSDEQQQRMLSLADKGNRGTLSQDEQAELDRFRRVGNFPALMHAKARLSLRHGGQLDR
jgi:hypothetical protein